MSPANIAVYTGNNSCCEDEPPIFFTSADATVIVLWDSDRKSKFGEYPEFQVYTTDGTTSLISGIAIEADQPYPDTTQFTIYTNNINGFIVIK